MERNRLFPEALRERPEAEVMHRRVDRRTPTVRIGVDVEGVIGDPVHEPARMTAGSAAVVPERPLRVAERVCQIVYSAELRANPHYMASMDPGHHIAYLHPALIGERLEPKRCRSPKDKPLWANRDLRCIPSRPHRRLLRPRLLGLVELVVSTVLQAYLVGETWPRHP